MNVKLVCVKEREKSTMTTREIIMYMARYAYETGLFDDQDLKEMSNNYRGYNRAKRLLKGANTQKD